MNVYIVSSLAVLSVTLGGALALPGGWNEIAVDDAKVVELAGWAVGEIGNGYSLLEIKGAEYQVCPSQFTFPGHYLTASETPFEWHFADGPIVVRFYVLKLFGYIFITSIGSSRSVISLKNVADVGRVLFLKIRFPKIHHRKTIREWERSDSVVECLTRDRGATGSSLTGVTLWSLSKTHLSSLSTSSTKEDPPLFNLKNIDGT